MSEEDKPIHIDSVSESESEPEPYEPFRYYTAVSDNYRLDWNMLFYKIEDKDGYELDWNKLIYNEEQLAEFTLQKKEKIVRTELADFLFKPPSERSAMERFFLSQSGFCNGDEKDETDTEYDKIVENMVVLNA